MTFLIDGYNLLHAVGWAPRRGRAKLEAARRRLLDWLAESPPMTRTGVRVRVVFDAQHGRAPSVGQSHRGVQVQFAYRQTADDLIEELLQAEPIPQQVTVVSNDTRLIEAARRVGSVGWGSRQFLDYLITASRDVPGSAYYVPPEKPAAPAPDETADLLRVFADPKPREPRADWPGPDR